MHSKTKESNGELHGWHQSKNTFPGSSSLSSLSKAVSAKAKISTVCSWNLKPCTAQPPYRPCTADSNPLQRRKHVPNNPIAIQSPLQVLCSVESKENWPHPPKHNAFLGQARPRQLIHCIVSTKIWILRKKANPSPVSYAVAPSCPITVLCVGNLVIRFAERLSARKVMDPVSSAPCAQNNPFSYCINFHSPNMHVF